MRRALLALALLAAPLAPSAASAQQPELYGPQPPAGSAFIRFVNATGGELSVRPDFLPAETLGIQPTQRVTAYRVVEKVAGRAMTVELRAGTAAARASVTAAPGAFVTILVATTANGIAAQTVVDGADGNLARARLAFYNAAVDCPAASLGIENGATIFPEVAPGTSRTRQVNPANASLVASCATRRSAAIPLTGLEAGGRYSIWMLPGVTPVAFVTRDIVPGAWSPSR